MIRLAFSTLGCPSWPLARVLDAASRLGYDGVELRFLEGDDALWARPELTGSGLRETRARLADAGLAVPCVDTRSFFHSPDPAARRGEAQHHVVEPCIGNEVELLEQRAGLLVVEVDALYQQRPLRSGRLLERPRPEGTVDDVPASACAGHEPGLDVLATRQRPQLGGAEPIADLGQRSLHMKRLLLPVPAQELRRRERPQDCTVHRARL